MSYSKVSASEHELQVQSINKPRNTEILVVENWFLLCKKYVEATILSL